LLTSINYTGGQVTFPSAIYVPLIPEARRLHMVCFRYVIVNTLHKGENKDDDNDNDNNNNPKFIA